VRPVPVLLAPVRLVPAPLVAVREAVQVLRSSSVRVDQAVLVPDPVLVLPVHGQAAQVA
jgi:hypothetical protein